MTNLEAFSRIKKLFTEVPTLKDTKMSDGRMISTEGEVAVGCKCAMKDMNGAVVAIEDGDYTLEDGRILSIAAGVITAIKEMEVEKEMEMWNELRKDIDAIKSQLATPNNDNQFNSLKSENESLKNAIATLKTQLESFEANVKEGFKLVEAIGATPAAEPIKPSKNVFAPNKEANELKFKAMGDVIKNLNQTKN